MKFNLANRFDLLTGEILECKSPKSYHLQNFKDKRNMKKFFSRAKEENKLDELTDLIRNIFDGYAKLKKLEFAPSQTDLKSIKYLPHIISINEYYPGGYKSLLADLGLTCRFNYQKQIILPELPLNLEIKIDSREQKGFVLGKEIKTEIKCLPFGDYTIERDNQVVFVERKSQMDLIGTMGKGFDRFCREIQRAKDASKYIVVLVEQKFSNIASFNYQLGYFGKATPEYIFRQMRELCKKFDNVQFLFADGKKEAAKLVPYILLLNEDILEIDLEYNYNSGLINF
jgi:hypothetical protein